MCGIAGAIGEGFHLPYVQTLCLLNESRGNHSFGFFDSKGKMRKAAKSVTTLITEAPFVNFAKRAARARWGLCGHTRFATQGKVTDANAHPFRYGNITGIHNGMVDAPNTYTVDSEYLIDTINRKGYTGLNGIEGYWALAWYDKGEDCFYLTQHDGDLHYAILGGVVYFASLASQLRATLPEGAVITEVKEGQVLQILRDGTILDSENGDIEGITAPSWWGKYQYQSVTSGGRWSSKYDYTDDYSYSGSKFASSESDYNSDKLEWSEAWQDYIHSMENAAIANLE